MKNKIKVIGVIATIVGMAATFISEWASEASIEETVEEKVNEILMERERKENEE